MSGRSRQPLSSPKNSHGRDTVSDVQPLRKPPPTDAVLLVVGVEPEGGRCGMAEKRRPAPGCQKLTSDARRPYRQRYQSPSVTPTTSSPVNSLPPRQFSTTAPPRRGPPRLHQDVRLCCVDPRLRQVPETDQPPDPWCGSPFGDRRRVVRVDPIHAHPARRDYLRMFTARAMTSAAVTNETDACSIIANFAHRDNGIVSVGLKAVALVNDTYP